MHIIIVTVSWWHVRHIPLHLALLQRIPLRVVILALEFSRIRWLILEGIMRMLTLHLVRELLLRVSMI